MNINKEKEKGNTFLHQKYSYNFVKKKMQGDQQFGPRNISE